MTEQEYPLPYRIHLVPITGPSIETNSWACGECKTVRGAYVEAYKCCLPTLCSMCNKVTGNRYHYLCKVCSAKEVRVKEQSMWDKMPEVEYTGGPVHDGVRFFQDEEEYWDYYDEKDGDGIVELCNIKKVGYNISPGCVLDFINERALEEIEDHDLKLDGMDELQVALEKFFESQTYMIWVPNGKKAILKQPEES